MTAKLIGNVVHYTTMVHRTMTLSPLERHMMDVLDHHKATEALMLSRRGGLSSTDASTIVDMVKGPAKPAKTELKAVKRA